MSTPMTTPTGVSEQVRSRTGMVRVGIALLLGTVAYIAPFSAGSAVLLPARIAVIAPDDKIQLLALLTSVAAVVALLSNIVFGAVSDLTRTRFGSRTPWIVLGSLGTAVLMVPVSRAEGFGELFVWWCLAIIPLNAVGASVNAILPDRVPTARRATMSALIGLGLLLGTAIGSVLGAAFLGDTGRGFIVVGVVSVVLATASVLIAPDLPSPTAVDGAPARRLDLSGLSNAFRLPRGASDFYWALVGRLMLVLGYFMINSFQLYLFTDYVGLDESATADALALNSIIFLGTAIVGSLAAGPLSDRLGRRKPFVVGASLIAVLAIAVPFASSTTLGMIGFATVGGLAFGMYYAVDAALVSEVLPGHDSRARDLGILNTANTGGQALAPAASAALLGLGIGFAPVFLGAMIACAIGAVCIPAIRGVR